MTAEYPLTAEAARFITRTRAAQIPREVMRLGKRSLLDGLGLALAGNAAESGKNFDKRDFIRCGKKR